VITFFIRCKMRILEMLFQNFRNILLVPKLTKAETSLLKKARLLKLSLPIFEVPVTI